MQNKQQYEWYWECHKFMTREDSDNRNDLADVTDCDV